MYSNIYVRIILHMKSNFRVALNSQHYTVYKLLLLNVGIGLGYSAAVKRLCSVAHRT